MKKNVLLVPFIAVVVLMSLSFIAAEEIASPYSLYTQVNNVYLSSYTTLSGTVGDTIPVSVTFTAAKDASDVRVKVFMEGTRDDISASTERFDVVSGSTYNKLLNLELPSDAKNLTKEFTLYVEVVSASDRTEKMYKVRLQRESYTIEILSVDYTSKVSAGNMVPVSVVAKNNGYNRVDDNYVVVSIPALDVSVRGYMGDFIPVENGDLENEEDSVEKVVYLKIPENAPAGVYEMNVEVYNDDAQATVTKLISVTDSGTVTILAAVKNKDMNAGETITYDLVVVNSADSIKVFNVRATSGSVLDVSVPSVVTVGPDSSETISVTVSAADDAKAGTYTFSVDVDGKQVVFGADVVGESTSTSFVALTVILVIIFVVLLAVLVVLLTRRERTIEEVETSYY